MDIVRLIKTDREYDQAMEEVEGCFDDPPEPGTAEGDRFELLLHLVAHYEARRFPVPVSDPVDVLWFAIRDLGRSQSELAGLLGSRSRASEILNRRRALNLDQIRSVSAAWHIPVAALTPAYELEPSVA